MKSGQLPDELKNKEKYINRNWLILTRESRDIRWLKWPFLISAAAACQCWSLTLIEVQQKLLKRFRWIMCHCTRLEWQRCLWRFILSQSGHLGFFKNRLFQWKLFIYQTTWPIWPYDHMICHFNRGINHLCFMQEGRGRMCYLEVLAIGKTTWLNFRTLSVCFFFHQ